MPLICVSGWWNLSHVLVNRVIVVVEDPRSKFNGADLSAGYVFVEQRIGVSHSPVSGGGEVQRVGAQVSLLLYLYFFNFKLKIKKISILSFSL